MITTASGTGCLEVLQAHTACKAEWLSIHGQWPPSPCKVREWIFPPGHHLSPRQQGIPGCSGPLREGRS